MEYYAAPGVNIDTSQTTTKSLSKCTTYHLSKVRNMGKSVGTCTLREWNVWLGMLSLDREDISGVQSSSLRKAHTAQLQVGPRLCMAGRWIHHVFLSIFPLRLFSTYDFPRPYQDDPRSVCCWPHCSTSIDKLNKEISTPKHFHAPLEGSFVETLVLRLALLW